MAWPRGRAGGGDVVDFVQFKTAADSLGSPVTLPGGVSVHTDAAHKIMSILHRTLARAERAAPVAAQGAFIPVGASYTAVDVLMKIFGTATASVLIVDPHADANLLSDFVLLVPEGVRVMVLAKARPKPALLPAAKAWLQQYGQARPLEVRLAPEHGIHDRLIIVDDRDAWTVGQSFNALAKHAPTSMGRVADPETAEMKIAAHRSIWMAADPLL